MKIIPTVVGVDDEDSDNRSWKSTDARSEITKDDATFKEKGHSEVLADNVRLLARRDEGNENVKNRNPNERTLPSNHSSNSYSKIDDSRDDAKNDVLRAKANGNDIHVLTLACLGLGLFLAAFVGCGLIVLIALGMQGAQEEDLLASPREDLRDFALAATRDHALDLSSIEEMEAERFKVYSAAYCLEAEGLERARKALAVGLPRLPENVRETVVTTALQEGISGQNSFRDSTSDLVDSTKAHSFMAYYSTSFKPSKDGATDKYQTCVMVSGVELVVGEHVAAWEETTEEIQIGTKVDCSSFFSSSCSRIPQYGKRTFRKPIMKRYSLSLKHQQELHTWMVQEAIEEANHLLGPSPKQLESGRGGLALGEWEATPRNKGWKWESPEYEL